MSTRGGRTKDGPSFSVFCYLFSVPAEPGHRTRASMSASAMLQAVGGRGCRLAEELGPLLINRSGEFGAVGNDGDGAGRIMERPSGKGGRHVLEACLGFLVPPRHP